MRKWLHQAQPQLFSLSCVFLSLSVFVILFLSHSPRNWRGCLVKRLGFEADYETRLHWIFFHPLTCLFLILSGILQRQKSSPINKSHCLNWFGIRAVAALEQWLAFPPFILCKWHGFCGPAGARTLWNNWWNFVHHFAHLYDNFTRNKQTHRMRKVWISTRNRILINIHLLRDPWINIRALEKKKKSPWKDFLPTLWKPQVTQLNF